MNFFGNGYQVQHPGAHELMMTDIRNQKMFAAFLQRFDVQFDILSILDELEHQVYSSLSSLCAKYFRSFEPGCICSQLHSMYHISDHGSMYNHSLIGLMSTVDRTCALVDLPKGSKCFQGSSNEIL